MDTICLPVGMLKKDTSMKKIKIAMYINHSLDKMNACTMYRNITPFKYLRQVEVRYINDVETEIEYDPIKRQVKNIQIQSEPIDWADVVVFSRHYDNVALMGCLAEVAQKMKKPIVYETDDLLHKVEQNIGGHKMELNTMNRNLRFADYVLPKADLVTVTTAPLKEFYQSKTKTNIEVLPNFYDPKHWLGLYHYAKLRQFFRKRILKDKVIRIGWQGGNNHFLNNFNHIVDPLNKLHQKYGVRFKFVSFSGHNPNLDMFGGEKGKRKFLDFDFEHVPGVQLKDFPKKLASLDLDIGLIVVDDNEFSRAKSNIKWMEYSLLGIPAIASRCLPYLNTNAVLVENTTEDWFNALEQLMLDEEKRGKIGLEARKMVRDYSIKKHAYKWLEAYKHILADRTE